MDIMLDLETLSTAPAADYGAAKGGDAAPPSRPALDDEISF